MGHTNNKPDSILTTQRGSRHVTVRCGILASYYNFIFAPKNPDRSRTVVNLVKSSKLVVGHKTVFTIECWWSCLKTTNCVLEALPGAHRSRGTRSLLKSNIYY